MNADAIREKLNRQPFEHFEVIMSNGQRHLVKDPECAMLLRTKLIVADPVADRIADLSLDNVVEVRPAVPRRAVVPEGDSVGAEAIREKLNQRPFEPFQIVMSSGHLYLVKDPEIVHLSQSDVTIGNSPANCEAVLSLDHVIELRQVEPQSAA